MIRHFWTALVAAAALAGFGGCHDKKEEARQVEALLNSMPPVPTAPATRPAENSVSDPTSSDVLATRMQSYARELEPWASQRSARRTAEGSVAEFLRPEEFRIGPAQPTNSAPRKADPPVNVVPLERPVTDHTGSTANQGASIASASARATPAPSGGAPRLITETGAPIAPAAGTRDILPSTGASAMELTIARQLRDNPKDLWAHLDYQLFQFLQDKPTPQLEPLSRLSAEDRELIAAVMDAMNNFRAGTRADSNMLMSKKVKPLLDMADRVRSQADLVVPTVALCTRVDAFGVYEPFDPPRFIAMREHAIIIYCEVENFASHLNDKRLWETRLSQEVVLYTETGLPVWQDRTDKIVDFARRRRHDFFLVKKARFPANITIGRYLLKVTVVDQQANRVAESTLPVQFVAQ